MSAPYSAASAGSTSGSNAPACALCGNASRTPTAVASSSGTGPASRAIPTCAPLWPTPDASVMQLGEKPETWLPRVAALKERVGNGNGHGMPLTIAAQIGPTWRLEQGNSCPCRCHTSMSSPVAFPARTSPTPAAAPGSTGSARVFGPSTPDSFANYDPATSSWRTSQLSLLEEWSAYSGTWPRAGMTRNGTAYPLRPLAPLTGETESGSWPTPTHRLGMARGAQAKRYHDPARSNDLDDAVAATPETWPTPTASDFAQTRTNDTKRHGSLHGEIYRRAMWATPKATDADKGGRGDLIQQVRGNESPSGHFKTPTAAPFSHGGSGGELHKQVAPSGGPLNPQWVAWLMGFPIDWTSLPPSGTPSCPRSPSGSDEGSSSMSSRVAFDEGER
jgi:hypothetical protein